MGPSRPTPMASGKWERQMEEGLRLGGIMGPRLKRVDEIEEFHARRSE